MDNSVRQRIPIEGVNKGREAKRFKIFRGLDDISTPIGVGSQAVVFIPGQAGRGSLPLSDELDGGKPSNETVSIQRLHFKPLGARVHGSQIPPRGIILDRRAEDKIVSDMLDSHESASKDGFEEVQSNKEPPASNSFRHTAPAVNASYSDTITYNAVHEVKRRDSFMSQALSLVHSPCAVSPTQGLSDVAMQEWTNTTNKPCTYEMWRLNSDELRAASGSTLHYVEMIVASSLHPALDYDPSPPERSARKLHLTDDNIRTAFGTMRISNCPDSEQLCALRSLFAATPSHKYVQRLVLSLGNSNFYNPADAIDVETVAERIIRGIPDDLVPKSLREKTLKSTWAPQSHKIIMAMLYTCANVEEIAIGGNAGMGYSRLMREIIETLLGSIAVGSRARLHFCNLTSLNFTYTSNRDQAASFRHVWKHFPPTISRLRLDINQRQYIPPRPPTHTFPLLHTLSLEGHFEIVSHLVLDKHTMPALEVVDLTVDEPSPGFGHILSHVSTFKETLKMLSISYGFAGGDSRLDFGQGQSFRSDEDAISSLKEYMALSTLIIISRGGLFNFPTSGIRDAIPEGLREFRFCVFYTDFSDDRPVRNIISQIETLCRNSGGSWLTTVVLGGISADDRVIANTISSARAAGVTLIWVSDCIEFVKRYSFMNADWPRVRRV